MARMRCFVLMSCCLLIGGCHGDPPIYPISGRVTLDGDAYERLLVYMRPVEGETTTFNMGVGETDARGTLTLRSTAGDGLQEGKYRVSFSCMRTAGGDSLAGDQKQDDNPRLVTEEIVPAPYSDDAASPVFFEVTPTGANNFRFDIPAS